MLYLVMALLFVVPLWKICARAGFQPWLALLAMIPLAGPAIVIGILAFKPWPAAQGASDLSSGAK